MDLNSILSDVIKPDIQEFNYAEYKTLINSNVNEAKSFSKLSKKHISLNVPYLTISYKESHRLKTCYVGSEATREYNRVMQLIGLPISVERDIYVDFCQSIFDQITHKYLIDDLITDKCLSS